MSENTKIEWADHTFNPWIGCQEISPGCKHCYAADWAKRYGRDFARRTRTSDANWKQPLKWNAQAAREGRRFRVFCASLADVFDNQVPPTWRADLFELIEDTPHLDWLLLTKRIGNAQAMIGDALLKMRDLESIRGQQWPWPNVWLGATIVNQEEADRDIPKLLAVPAAKRFLSMEPLLGAVDLDRVFGVPFNAPFSVLNSKPHGYTRCVDHAVGYCLGDCPGRLPHLDWVIVGGESGPGARPMHPSWARALRDQCKAAGVPFLFKQWGEFAPNWLNDDGNKIPGSEWMDRMGKKLAGRELDGVVHDGFPEV